MSVQIIHTAIGFLFFAVWAIVGQIMVGDRQR